MALFNLFSKSSGSVLGIDVGSSSIKVVELEKRGDFVELLTYGLLEISPYGGKEIGRSVQLSQEKTVEALTDLLKEAKTKSRVSGLSIPFRSSFMRLIEVPQVTEKELQKIIPLEARKYIPVPIEEVSLDWGLVPKISGAVSEEGRDGFINVLLVAIHNDVWNRFNAMSKKLQLNNQFLEVESYSSMRAIEPDSNEAVMLCDFGAGSVKVYVMYKGYMLSSYVINNGSQDITLNISRSMDIPVDEAEMLKREKGMTAQDNSELTKVIDLSLTHITPELERVKDGFERKYNVDITKGVLVGGGAQLKGLDAYLEKTMKIQIVKGDAFKRIKTPSFLSETIKEIGPEFTVAVGCALRAVSS